jgi:hypothetical protein
MEHWIAAALLLSLAFIAFSGCAQLGAPPQCLNASSGTLANCIYVNSVLEQSPYWCYSLSDMPRREKCLRDSTSSAMQKELERMPLGERSAIFAIGDAAVPAIQQALLPPQPSQPPPTVPTPVPPAANTQEGMPAGISGEDAQAFGKAVQENDMAPCVSISDKATRASCITQVALRVKKPSVCEVLAAQEDVDICNLYAKAGEQAK